MVTYREPDLEHVVAQQQEEIASLKESNEKFNRLARRNWGMQALSALISIFCFLGICCLLLLGGATILDIEESKVEPITLCPTRNSVVETHPAPEIIPFTLGDEISRPLLRANWMINGLCANNTEYFEFVIRETQLIVFDAHVRGPANVDTNLRLYIYGQDNVWQNLAFQEDLIDAIYLDPGRYRVNVVTCGQQGSGMYTLGIYRADISR